MLGPLLLHHQQWGILAGGVEGPNPLFTAYQRAEPEVWSFPSDSVVLPLELTSVGTPTAEVMVNGEPYRFWIDTGAGLTVEWHWSPGGDALAYTDSGQMGTGEIVWINAESGEERTLGDERTPSFDTGQGEVPPLWSADGRYVYAVGGVEMWRLEVASGRSEQLATIPGWRAAALAKAFEHPTIWTTVDRSEAAVLTRAPGRSAVHLVDLETGEARLIVEEEKSYTEAAFNFTAATGDLTFLSSDRHSLGDVWVLGSESGELRRGTRLNEALERYQLAETELIAWHSLDGEPLRGALLLPPGYQRGEPLPLVVWVYGGHGVELREPVRTHARGDAGVQPARARHPGIRRPHAGRAPSGGAPGG